MYIERQRDGKRVEYAVCNSIGLVYNCIWDSKLQAFVARGLVYAPDNVDQEHFIAEKGNNVYMIRTSYRVVGSTATDHDQPSIV